MQKLEYLPDNSFTINNQTIVWHTDRSTVREALANSHNEDDSISDLSEFFDGDSSYNIETRRDIYTDFNNSENYFFFSYDKQDKITEIEIHSGFTISINGINITFGEDIAQVVNRLNTLDDNYLETEEGNYLFPDLKITVASDESMGGDGTGFSYFYAAKDITHLIDSIE